MRKPQDNFSKISKSKLTRKLQWEEKEGDVLLDKDVRYIIDSLKWFSEVPTCWKASILEMLGMAKLWLREAIAVLNKQIMSQ